MSDRCINLRDWEAAAQPAASVIVRPARQRIRAQGEIGPESLWHPPPCKIGDRAILREAWQLCDINWYLLTIRYRADKLKREVEIDGDLLKQLISRPWRPWETPQTMPAALSRWRRPVVSVEAVEITAVSEETWVAAGFRARSGGNVLHPTMTWAAQSAREAWLSTYGPGSWSGWVWVVTMGKEEGA